MSNFLKLQLLNKKIRNAILILLVACMAELVDAIDSKSIFLPKVPVQVRIQAPNRY